MQQCQASEDHTSSSWAGSENPGGPSMERSGASKLRAPGRGLHSPPSSRSFPGRRRLGPEECPGPCAQQSLVGKLKSAILCPTGAKAVAAAAPAPASPLLSSSHSVLGSDLKPKALWPEAKVQNSASRSTTPLAPAPLLCPLGSVSTLNLRRQGARQSAPERGNQTRQADWKRACEKAEKPEKGRGEGKDKATGAHSSLSRNV